MIDENLRDDLFEWYTEYAFSFAEDGVLLPAMKKLKYEHSLRVAENALEIARAENWDTGDVLLAEVAGLFHDVGRYKQFREFRTFQDHRSINHAECGYDVLAETGCLDHVNAREREIIMEATRMHNMRVVPSGISEDILRYLHLVRDSDKLDIYYVLYDAVKNKRFDEYPEIVHGVDLDGEPSPEIIDAALRREPISYSMARSLCDFLLILMQWVYDFHYRGSYQIFSSRGLIDHMEEILPSHPRVLELVADARKFMVEKIN